MKLVDILARELKEWPEEWNSVQQGSSGRLYRYGSSEWISTQEIADDRLHAIVTRAEWQAAVDALKAAKVSYSAENVSVNNNYATHTNSPINSDCKIVQPKWNGEGLPPVGAVCEFAGGTHCHADPFDKDLHEGDQVTIIAHFKDGDIELAAFTFNPQPRNPNRGTACVEQGAYGCFRPIRTSEQIAEEDREKAVEAMLILGGMQSGPLSERVKHMKAIYDAGYRKFEIVE
jgi:hypothetical protein